MARISEEVNIYEIPSVENVPPGTTVTLGDLHANFITLMFALVKHGIASNITATQYRTLVDICLKEADSLSANDLQQFKKMIGYLVIRDDVMLRLIGDEVADRHQGPDICFIEAILVIRRIEILLSNHGIELLDRSEKGRPFSDTRIPFPYTNSAHQLQRLIDNKLVDREEIERILDYAYKPHLKVISYSYGEGKEFFLYSHAPTGLKQIRNLIREFACDYLGDGIEIFTRGIDCVNKKFHDYLRNKKAHQLYDYERLGSNSGAIDFIIWNRQREGLDRPKTLYGYDLRFVHGHDSSDKDKDPPHIINLDGLLGKALDLNKGEYSVLVQFPSVSQSLAMENCHHTGPKALSLEMDNVQTSAATRLSFFPSLFSAFGTVKSPPFISAETNDQAPSIPNMLCQPIGYGEDKVPALACGNAHFNAQIFLKESTETAVSTVTQRAAGVDNHCGLTGDTYSQSSCQPIEHFGQASVRCEGEQTSLIYTPHRMPGLFDGLDANLMLGAVFWHMAKQGYAWLTGAVEENSECIPDADLVNTDVVEVRMKFNELKRQLFVIEAAISKEDSHRFSWAQETQLELHQERLEALAAQTKVSMSDLEEIELDILQLRTGLLEIAEIAVYPSITAIPIKDKTASVALNTAGMFATNNRVLPSNMVTSYHDQGGYPANPGRCLT